MFLLLKLRVARGVPHRGAFDPAFAGDFEAFMRTGQPAFFGTFHFGQSDLLGYLLGHVFRRQVFMVRLQMGNAADTQQLGRLFGEWIKFIWVNKPENSAGSLSEGSPWRQVVRWRCNVTGLSSPPRPSTLNLSAPAGCFPLTIYHLALLFDRPVLFCLGLAWLCRAIETVLHSSKTFVPDRSLSREANLQRAREHFQDMLTHLETLVRTITGALA